MSSSHVPEAEKSIKNALADGRLSKTDADRIREFLADARAVNGISENRIDLYASSLCRMARFIPSFSDATTADLYNSISALRSPTARDGERPYKPNTIQSTVVILRLFFRWMVENGYTTIPRERIDRIKVPKKDQMTKTASQMLTPEEVQAIADKTRRTGDRAIVWMLYEGGFRIGELLKRSSQYSRDHDAACQVNQPAE